MSQVANAGVEVLEVIETQLLQRQPDGSIIIESKPLLAAPGASKFTTHAFFSMKEEVNGHKNCTVRYGFTAKSCYQVDVCPLMWSL